VLCTVSRYCSILHRLSFLKFTHMKGVAHTTDTKENATNSLLHRLQYHIVFYFATPWIIFSIIIALKSKVEAEKERHFNCFI
jgi:hypothetical protein